MKANNIISIITAVLCLNCCYFNSAEHIFDRAKYEAALSTYGISANKGDKVYTDGKSYYIDVRMCRYDKPIRTQYDAFTQNGTNDNEKRVSRVIMRTAEIPEDFAMYLMGKASTPKSPSYMKLAKSKVKNKCQSYPIVKTPEVVDVFFQYRSPGALGYYALGTLDWLCVDLPITCVENALAIPCYTLGAVMGGLGNGLGKMGHAFNESAARMNAQNRNIRATTTNVIPSTNYGYVPPSQPARSNYSIPVVQSHGYAPPLQTQTDVTPVSTPSYTQTANMTLQDLEARRQFNQEMNELFERDLEERRENFKSMMNLIDTESSPKYIP